jgi:uncharacterized membrane protein
MLAVTGVTFFETRDKNRGHNVQLDREAEMRYGMMGPMNGGGGYQALFVVVILLLLAVILLLFLRQRPAQPEKPEPEAEAGEPGAAGSEDKLEVALRLLDENERRVVEALVARGGSMLQKDISYELGFSRVKAHRVVQSLVRRGLVTAEEHYNTNRVSLVDWLKG